MKPISFTWKSLAGEECQVVMERPAYEIFAALRSRLMDARVPWEKREPVYREMQMLVELHREFEPLASERPEIDPGPLVDTTELLRMAEGLKKRGFRIPDAMMEQFERGQLSMTAPGSLGPELVTDRDRQLTDLSRTVPDRRASDQDRTEEKEARSA